MPSKPIPGSTGDVLTCLPSPYLAHGPTGLLYLPRFIAKCRYVKAHGALPPSYAKNYKRGLDRMLCLHLGVDPAAVERIVHESADDAELDRRLLALFPTDVRDGQMEPGARPARDDAGRTGVSPARRWPRWAAPTAWARSGASPT